MLKLSVLTYNGQPPSTLLDCSIPINGNTVGRQTGCALVLDDPVKTISRTHLRFFKKGDHYCVANSSRDNWAFVNERKLEAGEECPVQDSDQIMIGAYVLNVREMTAHDNEAVPGNEAVLSVLATEATEPDITCFPAETEAEVIIGEIHDAWTEAHVIPATDSEKDADIDPAIDIFKGLQLEIEAPDKIPRNDFLGDGEETGDEETPVVVPQPNFDALGWAFIEGLGMAAPSHAQIAPDPAFMREAGELLRACVEGVLKLLSARTTLKKNIRAQLTHIEPALNNPLKFSPDAEVALGYLFGPRVPGFLAPLEAIDETFKDLKAHGLGVMSGAEKEFRHLLAQFSPAAIAKENGSKRAGLLSIHRQAQLWRAYEAYYDKASTRVKDDFEGFFGKAFLDGYTEAVNPARPQPDLRNPEEAS